MWRVERRPALDEEMAAVNVQRRPRNEYEAQAVRLHEPGDRAGSGSSMQRSHLAITAFPTGARCALCHFSSLLLTDCQVIGKGNEDR